MEFRERRHKSHATPLISNKDVFVWHLLNKHFEIFKNFLYKPLKGDKDHIRPVHVNSVVTELSTRARVQIPSVKI